MPIYEYQCPRCSDRTEVLQQTQKERTLNCDKCGVGMKRVISSSAFILKGSGWYVTDYPSQSRKKAMEAEKKGRAKKNKDAPAKKTKPSSSPAGKKRAGSRRGA